MNSLVFIEPAADSGGDYAAQWQEALALCRAMALDVVVVSSQAGDLWTKLETLRPEIVVGCSLDSLVRHALKGLGSVLVSFERVAADNFADITIDYSAEDITRYFTGPRFDLRTEPKEWFLDVVQLVRRLAWDSDFFGFNVAYLSCRHLTPSIERLVSKYCSGTGVRVLEYLANCHDSESVRQAEINGYRFTDIRMTFEKHLNGEPGAAPKLERPGLSYGLAEERHIESLRDLSRGIYRDSRYYFDKQFPEAKVTEFYQGWVEKAVKGTFDHECHCIFQEDQPIAFCTIRYVTKSNISIGLFGVRSDQKGGGIASHLLDRVFEATAARGARLATVVTQGRNYAAQRVYQKAGFRTRNVELWYHKWM